MIVDCALSQFSFGKIEECRLKGIDLPVPGGYDEDGNLTTNPAAIEKTWRVLPMGYWKGSGISILLDLIATVLTDANSVADIGEFKQEIGLSQVMIAIDAYRFESEDSTDAIVEALIADIKSSTPIKEGDEVFYPGELEMIARKDGLDNGIPVVSEKWETVCGL